MDDAMRLHFLVKAYRQLRKRSRRRADDDRGVRLHAYRIHDTTGDDLGTVEHPAPNVAPGDVIALSDGRESARAPRALRRTESDRSPR